MTVEMQNLCAKRGELLNTLSSLDPEKDGKEYDNFLSQIEATDAAIDRLERSEKLGKQSATTLTPPENKKRFANFGEQIKAIVAAGKSKGRNVDPRLIEINNEIKGTNTETDEDGGYAIQSDFMGNILDRAYERSEIISRCTTYTVSTDSNRVNYVTIDDSEDAATSDHIVVAGGVQVYWVGEGETVAPSKPKIKSTELKLSKMMGIAYVTEEALQDINFMSQLISDSFSDAVAGLLTNGVIRGNGEQMGEARQPVGILNSSALVTVTPADSTKLTYTDLLGMKAHMRKKNWSNAAWFVHPDLEAVLPTLADENGNQVYMPAGGISGAQYETILGRPIIYDEFTSAKGSKGDIILADFSEYLLIKKGEERKDWSMHVEFLTDQQCFRIVMRVNGAPKYNNTYSVRNSESRRGVFVTLGARTSP